MRMNLYVATCSLLAMASQAVKFDYQHAQDLAQTYHNYDDILALAETYGEETDKELVGRIKGLEAKVDTLLKSGITETKKEEPAVVVEKPVA